MFLSGLVCVEGALQFFSQCKILKIQGDDSIGHLFHGINRFGLAATSAQFHVQF